MEYLMTYGWAILIIAVVLGALFSLGVFSGSSLLGTSCIASPGYSCSNPILNNAGTLSFTFGQNTGSTIYNVELACAATSTGTGQPSSTALGGGYNSLLLSASGGGSPGLANGITGGVSTLVGNQLSSGQTVQISGWPCYGTTGSALGSQSIGAAFSGFIWMNYTSSQCTMEASGCPWLTAKVLTVTVKVT